MFWLHTSRECSRAVSALPACWKASPKMILQSKPGVLIQIGRLERALIPFRAFVNATH